MNAVVGSKLQLWRDAATQSCRTFAFIPLAVV
jgi:hypothetical protein